ncbi:MAG: hypothetical protein KFH98_01800, partial [Gemmatimonadetes bacterium]|nr:hypothetical protein [Gemmatimonadota bacterium]
LPTPADPLSAGAATWTVDCLPTAADHLSAGAATWTVDCLPTAAWRQRSDVDEVLERLTIHHPFTSTA